MRFKDYIVKRAIKINYDNIVDSEKKLTLLDNAVLSASTKLGYKLLDTIKSKKSIDIPKKEWESILNRYYGSVKSDKIYLEWDTGAHHAIYFDKQGYLYYGIDGIKYELISPIECFKLYNKHHDFLEFAKEYYKNIETIEKQYMLIGYDDKHRFYLCTDGKTYYKFTDKGSYQICTEKLQKQANKYMEKLG